MQEAQQESVNEYFEVDNLSERARSLEILVLRINRHGLHGLLKKNSR